MDIIFQKPHTLKKSFYIDSFLKDYFFFILVIIAEINEWKSKGALTEKHCFHLVFRLADEIEAFINVIPTTNKRNEHLLVFLKTIFSFIHYSCFNQLLFDILFPFITVE